MHFSASDGGGRSVSIWDHYEVDDGVYVSGQTSASFKDGLTINDMRKISGPGDIYAVQGYSGSGGYAGASYIYARDASHTLALASAHLTPGALGVVQDVSIDGAAESAVVSKGSLGGRGAIQHASVMGGSLNSRQTIDIDGAIATSQDTQMTGFLPTAFGTAGYMDFNQGPGTLNLRGEGAAVAVSSIDILDGISEIDCNLATGTGNSAWAYGDIRSASSDRGAVGAGAGAGRIDLDADFSGGIQGLYIDGYGEAAGVGVGALGVENKISGTLAARTGESGTFASGTDIEASNKEGGVATAAAAGNLGLKVDLQNGFIGGGAEAAGVGVGAVGRKNEISAGTLAAGTGFFATGAIGQDIKASNREGTVAAAAAAGGLGGIVDLQNGFIGGGAEAAGVGVMAEGRRNWIASDVLAAGTGWDGTGAYGGGIEAQNREGAVGAGAAAGGLGAIFDLQNGFIAGWAEAAGVGVLAEGYRNRISSGTLAAGTGWDGTVAIGQYIEASNKEGGVAAAAAAGGLGAIVDLQNGFIGGGTQAAGVGVGAVGRKNEISAGTLAAGTGFFATGAIGQDIKASNREGTVTAAAAAGGGRIVYLQNGFIAAGAEAAGVGVVADGKENEISSGILAAGTGFFGTGALGYEIEGYNKRGTIVAVATAGGVGGMMNLQNGNGIVEAEGAIFGAGAAGGENEIGVGLVAARVGNSADVVAIDVNARSTEGAAGTGVAAGNAELQLLGGTPISLVAEGSAVGAGGYGATAAASADLLKADSGDSTSASGENLRLTVIDGDGIIGAISGTYDSSGPDRVASVSGYVDDGSAMIWGDFSADTSSSASASAENVGAFGTNIYLGSYADDGTADSEVYTLLGPGGVGAGGLNFGEMEAYAGDSTQAKLKYKVVGNYQIVAVASSSNPPDFDTDSDGGWAMTIKDVSGEAWTDNTGAHADVI